MQLSALAKCSAAAESSERQELGKQMEPQKPKDMRLRLRRIKPSSSTSLATKTRHSSTSVTANTNTKAFGADISSSDSDSDDFAMVRIKLAAALEAAAAHASGLSFDWLSIKAALTEADAALKAKEARMPASVAKKQRKKRQHCDTKQSAESVDAHIVDDAKTDTAKLQQEQHVCVSFHAQQNDDSSITSLSDMSDDDYDVIPNVMLITSDSDTNDDDVDLDTDNGMHLMGLSPHTAADGVSVVDDNNPMDALTKILSLPPFDPCAPQLQAQLIIKSIVSLAQLSMREDNEIRVEIKKSLIEEFSKEVGDNNEHTLSPFMDVSNIHVKHSNDEFFTFCSCKNCLKYREIVIHIMVEQFKAAHMVVMLLDVLIKAYGPMLKNVTAYNKFEKLLDANKEIYWIACGFIYNNKVEHMDYIYDESLSDNMIFVLFSSILMVNNPMLLLQILAFHVECIVKAYAEGFLETVEPDNSKIPAEEMLAYILDGYDDLCRISAKTSTYLFAFENDFLRRFSLTWTLLCQRLYQQHVYVNLTDTMLACIITLKEEELTSRHTVLIKKYIEFDDQMNNIDKRWTDIWLKLNKFNMSEEERKRRKRLSDVYRIFDTVVQDAIAFSLQESGDDNDFYDFQLLENRRLAWQNIMAYTKMKWADGFFEPPNTLVCDDKCRKCNVMLEYHAEFCKCITCSIAGGSSPPRRNADSTCYKCVAQSLVEKEVSFYESKILNVCTSDDFITFVRSNERMKNAALQKLNIDVSSHVCTGNTNNSSSTNSSCSSSSCKNERCNDANADGAYHVAWAVFQHMNTRKRYGHATIDVKYFCNACKQPACQLARKILNNELALPLTQQLIRFYQPLSMTRDEFRSILPNIMLYNRKMIASIIGIDLTDVHDIIVKIYWTFIISLYATFFVDFDEQCPLQLKSLEVIQNDIALRTDDLIGNPDDNKFEEFLDKIKSLSPFKSDAETDLGFTVDVNKEEIQNKLDNLFNLHKKLQNSPPNKKIPPPVINAIETAHATKEQPKKSCKEKPTKKCCFDHSDLGDHCKENHTNKKRIKKECNHARMNETRDRLRKKLTQLINARKNMRIPAGESAQRNITNVQQNTPKQPLTLKTAATVAAAEATNTAKKIDDEDDSLECLNTLCKRISHLHTSKVTTEASIADLQSINKKLSAVAAASSLSTSASTSSPLAMPSVAAASTVAKVKQTINSLTKVKSNNATASPTKDVLPVSTTSASTSSCTSVSTTATSIVKRTNPSSNCGPATSTSSSPSTAATAALSSQKASKDGLNMVSEIYEFLDNYSKDQNKVKKWLNYTLSYIEGSGSSANGKKQPQPTNPKKAAKKAKQKQRKEEEKRIIELHDLRAQFHDIYFKEFTDKQQLKTLKTSKKRDKKRIAELEANIKKLQRAKGKMETGILELIATVKQTSSDFKFAYLPTKEQQLEKLRELETTASDNDMDINAAYAVSEMAAAAAAVAQPLQLPMSTNNLNATTIASAAGSYSLPYAQANHFPYHIDFQAQGSAVGVSTSNTTYGMLRPPLPPPICYAPPQHQQLLPDVVAAMAAKDACFLNAHLTADPSKRIVTIRRVNLPNVPEPQVTVTAKGSSPDKDKLLYTFVNGQLVRTDTPPPPPPMTQLPLPHTQQAAHIAAHQLATSIPPPPTLSKTQLKKERRRLAKLNSEEAPTAADAEAAEQERREEEHELERAAAKSSKNNKAKDKKNTATVTKQTVELTYDMSKIRLKKIQPHTVTPSESSTSVSTMDAYEAGKIAHFKQQSRSASTTTSCSAGTSLSATPFSSQVNTRDNSVCSLRPATKANTKKGGKQQTPEPLKECVQIIQTNVQQNKQHTQQQQQQKSIKKQQQAAAMATSCVSSTTSTNVITKTESTPAPIQTLAEAQNVANMKISTELVKNERIKRTKLVDSGQFDNNPFKSLHMHDSDDSDCDSTKTYDDDGIFGQQQQQQPQQQQQHAKEKHATIAVLTTLPTMTMQSKAAAPKAEQTVKKRTNLVPTAQSSKPSLACSKVIEGKLTKQVQQTLPQPQKSEKMLRSKAIKSDDTPAPEQNSRGNNSNNRNRKTRSTQEQRPQQPQQQQKTHAIPNKQAQQQQQQPQSTLQHQLTQKQKTRNRNDNRQQGQQTATATSTAGNVNANATQRFERNNKTVAATDSFVHAQATNTKPLGSNNRSSSNRQYHCESQQKQQSAGESTKTSRPLSKRAQKQALRNKKFQKQQTHGNYEDCSAGIPDHMGYFNPNEVVIPPAPAKQQLQQQQQYNSLTQQMQALLINGSDGASSNHSTMQSQHYQVSSNRPLMSNVSIMDQLNRGVQVENLSLPPGITLTKVDPIKSEQLRQKSESIKKLSKPLQQQTAMPPQTFHHQSATTIIAPPVATMPSYYGVPYAGVAAASATLDQSSGVIMVEAKANGQPQTKSNKVASGNGASATGVGGAAASVKSSRNKKRRNKSKAQSSNSRNVTTSTNCSGSSSATGGDCASGNGNNPKMITLRNPMFHGGAASAAATILQPPSLMPGRTVSGLPLAPPVPMDQPAAIIKNDNGMFTIRNPALHQAVTNGLTLGGYRQFGNVNYYTPQEAAAEAARATQQQNTVNSNSSMGVGLCVGAGASTSDTTTSSPSFSYFSNSVNEQAAVAAAAATAATLPADVITVTSQSAAASNNTHNNISISCTSVGAGLIGDAAVIARPAPSQKCISAIGSEIKNAQQQKQKSKEHQWTNFGHELSSANTALPSLSAPDNSITCSPSGFLATGCNGVTALSNTTLQEKYQQSSYYNGFDVFSGKSNSNSVGGIDNSGSLFDGSDCHMHHNCGDESPPPTITGYNSYLEGIPNTGVIRYDNASFLKNLIPGQNLNNEVSIHNVNDSNFTRNSASPVAHRVEITPLYANRPTSTNIYEHCSSAGVAPDQQQQQQNFVGSSVANYRNNLANYVNDSNLFAPSSLLNMNELDVSKHNVDSFKHFNYDFEPPAEKQQQQQVIIDLNDLASPTASPYRDNANALDNFVQNMNALQISAPSEEQCPQLNGGGVSSTSGGAANSNTTTNGWW